MSKMVYFLGFVSAILTNCSNQAPIKNSYMFSNCFDYAKGKYCLSFKLDSLYRITDTLNGAGWGATKAYRFISPYDTISIQLYIEKYNSKATMESFTPTKDTEIKLFNDYGCKISCHKPVCAFFEGMFIACQGDKLNVMTYTGINHKNFENDEVGLFMVSEGKEENSNERRTNFEAIINSIKIQFEPI